MVGACFRLLDLRHVVGVAHDADIGLGSVSLTHLVRRWGWSIRAVVASELAEQDLASYMNCLRKTRIFL